MRAVDGHAPTPYDEGSADVAPLNRASGAVGQETGVDHGAGADPGAGRSAPPATSSATGTEPGRRHGSDPPARRDPGSALPGADAPDGSSARGAPGVASVLVAPAPALASTAPLPATPADSPGGRGWRHSYRLGLLLVLVVQSALAGRLLWSNTAFQDEAEYLWYGHMEWAHWLHGAPLPTYYLSGAPQVYPPLGALADSAGGLPAARLLSLAFMLAATALLYATASRLFGRNAGLIAAAMFVAVGPTTDMSAWATYDPMAIFVMALSAWLVVRAAHSRASDVWLFLAALAMVLAAATKWAAALWDPVIVALGVLSAPVGWVLALARGARLVSYAVLIAAPALFVFGGAKYMAQINSTTTQRGSGGTAPLSVLWTAAPLVAAVLVLALLAVLLSWRERAHRQALICAALTLAVILAPLYQAHIQTSVSLYKHVVFGAWFGAIAAGYGLSKAVVVNPAKGWRVGLAAALFTGLMGFDQASGWYGYWPNASPLLAAVERSLPAQGRMLMQNGDQMVVLYYLFHRHVQPNVMTSYAFSGDVISGMIESHYVWMVETDTGTGTPPGSLQESVAGNPAEMKRAGYRRIAHIRWRDPDGAVGWFTVWLLGGAG